VRHPCRLGLQRRIDDRRDLVYVIERFSPTPGSNIPQSVQTFLAKTLALQNYSIAIHRKLLCNRNIGLPGRGRHHDPASQSHLLWSSMRRNPMPELLLLHRRRLA
jgi:hypothetical protein